MQNQTESSNTQPAVTRFTLGDNVSRHATMSSLEIAELTGKRHDNVVRDILEMLKALKIDALSFKGIYSDSMNRPQTQYWLDRELTETLITGYSIELRNKVIRRLHELEAQQAKPRELSTLELLQIAMESEQQRIQLAGELAIAAPKAAFVDRYVESAGLKGFRQVAKLIGANESEFREFLVDQKIMYRLGGEWVATAPHLAAKRFQVKTTTAGSGHVANQSLFTAKGVEWVAAQWAVHALRGAA